MTISTAIAVVTFGVAAVAGTTGVQQPSNDARAVARGGFKEVATFLAQSAELVPADKYNYKPIATVRSFGGLVAHAADGMNWLCAQASGKKVEWSDAVEKGKQDKATLVAALKKATDACTAIYASPTGQLEQLMSNIAHSNLHYGNMITYMRMLGLKPPSS